MLRKIQMIAAIIATFFGAVALFDFFAVPSTQPTVEAPWPGISMMGMIPGWCYLITALALALLPIANFISIRKTNRAAAAHNRPSQDRWRRLTWGTSILETGGCLLFVMHSTLIFVPSAVALLIVGVGELACILHDVEHIPLTATRGATT